MAKWKQISESNNKFRLLCDTNDCTLSMCNLIDGILSITTIHNNSRHSLKFSNQDMRFIVSQYINNISKDEREEMLDFFHNF